MKLNPELFPLKQEDLPPSAYYESSAALDRLLGFRVLETEAILRTQRLARGDEELWLTLSPDSLQTPYEEFREIMEAAALRPDEQWVDLGAAYGRAGIVIQACYPGVRFLGIEKVEERVQEGRRVYRELDCDRAELRTGDVAQMRLPPADAYFMYDFGSERDVRSVLSQLKEIAKSRPIRVVGRGGRVRSLIDREEPWLSQVVTPRHWAHFSLYASA